MLLQWAALLGRVDAIIFTGGIGENSINVRKAVCSDLEFLGIKINDEKNTSKEKEKNISDDNTKVAVLVIPTNEELVIAMDTDRIVKEMKKN